MRIGIIAEGSEDQAVIRNILRAFGIDKSDIFDLKPSNQRDETDEHNPDNSTSGGLQGVKIACEGYTTDSGEIYRPYFTKAFSFLNVDFIVIHVDTAEIENQDFAFQRPSKNDLTLYCHTLRQQTIALINEWLSNNYAEKLLYAITIEEMEAWLLAIHLNTDTDTASSANPKKKWEEQILPKLKIANDHSKASKEFSKKKDLQKYLKNNHSLYEFVNSLKEAFEA